MDNPENYSRALKLFFQQINEQVKKNPNYQIDNFENEIINWAKYCGFSPRKFLEYYKNNDQNTPDTGSNSDI